MSEDSDRRIAQLEADLALAHHNIKQIIMWIEARIFAADTIDKRKTEADRHFIRSHFNV